MSEHMRNPDRAKRSHERFNWNEQCEVCWFADGQPGEPASLKCVDLGLGGIGLICSSPIATGTRGAVLLLSDGQSGRVRDVEVVHCRFDPSSGEHIVGGKWLGGGECADRMIVVRAKGGPQLAVRPSGPTAPAKRDAA